MANEFLMRKGYKSLANSEITGSLTTTGNISAEDNIFLTDAGSIRAKLILNSSDRDNVELRAESLGSTMKFFTVGTEALGLDASQNATFAGNITIGSPVHGAGALKTAGQVYIEHQGVNWNETSPGTTRGSIHMDPVGSGGNNTGNAITFGASDHSGGTVGDAGIYVRSDGSYGTKCI